MVQDICEAEGGGEVSREGMMYSSSTTSVNASAESSVPYTCMSQHPALLTKPLEPTPSVSLTPLLLHPDIAHTSPFTSLAASTPCLW